MVAEGDPVLVLTACTVGCLARRTVLIHSIQVAVASDLPSDQYVLTSFRPSALAG